MTMILAFRYFIFISGYIGKFYYFIFKGQINICIEFVARTLLPSDKEWLVQIIYRTVAILIEAALLTVCIKRNIESLKVIAVLIFIQNITILITLVVYSFIN